MIRINFKKYSKMKQGYEIRQRGIDPFTTIWIFNFHQLIDMVQWDDTQHVIDNEYLVAIFKIKPKTVK